MNLGFLLVLAALLGFDQPTAPPPEWTKYQRDAIAHIGKCLAEVGGGTVERLLQTTPGSTDESKLALDLIYYHKGCLNKIGSYRVNIAAMRGSAAEAMLRRRVELTKAVATQADTAPVRPPIGTNAIQVLDLYALCLVKAAPARALAVLNTVEGSTEETLSIKAFGELHRQCIPTDVAYHMGYDELRTHLASAIYLYGSSLLSERPHA